MLSMPALDRATSSKIAAFGFVSAFLVAAIPVPQPIPADAALGDYHFMIRLTDRAGWQQLHAVAIKITE